MDNDVRKARSRFWLLGAVVLVVVAAAVLLTRSGGGHGDSWLRASATLTPGVINPDVTQQTIRTTVCARGWTRTIRPPVSYTNQLKREQMAAWNLPGTAADYQEDHLISLELGGHPTDPRNLWPEPRPHAEEVDQLENELNDRICSGAISLREGQRKISEVKHESG